MCFMIVLLMFLADHENVRVPHTRLVAGDTGHEGAVRRAQRAFATHGQEDVLVGSNILL